MTDDLLPSIQTNAAAPRTVDVDGTSVTQQTLGDQIKADKYSKQAQAQAARAVPFRQVKLRLPGASGVDIHDGRF
jgi:hypothetical protein